MKCELVKWLSMDKLCVLSVATCGDGEQTALEMVEVTPLGLG